MCWERQATLTWWASSLSLRRETGVQLLNVQEARRRVKGVERHDSLAVWREQVEQALRGRGDIQDLARGASDAYEDLLGSLYFYYLYCGESMNAAEMGSREA